MSFMVLFLKIRFWTRVEHTEAGGYVWDAQSRGSEGAARPQALTSSQWLPCPPLRAAGPFTLPGPGATQGGGNLRPPLGELSDLTVALSKGRAVGAPVLGPPAQGAPWVVSPRRGPPGPDLEGFVPARLPGSVSGSVLGPRHRVKLLADLGCQVAESSPDFYTVQALWELRYPSQLQVQQGLWYLNGILLFIFLYLCVTLISFFINPENPSKWPSLSPLLLNTVVIKSHRCVVEDPKLAGRSPVGSAGHLMPRAPIIFCQLSRTCSQPHCTAPQSPHLPSAPGHLRAWPAVSPTAPHPRAPTCLLPLGTCGLGLQSAPLRRTPEPPTCLLPRGHLRAWPAGSATGTREAVRGVQGWGDIPGDVSLPVCSPPRAGPACGRPPYQDSGPSQAVVPD